MIEVTILTALAVFVGVSVVGNVIAFAALFAQADHACRRIDDGRACLADSRG